MNFIALSHLALLCSRNNKKGHSYMHTDYHEERGSQIHLSMLNAFAMYPAFARQIQSVPYIYDLRFQYLYSTPLQLFFVLLLKECTKIYATGHLTEKGGHSKKIFKVPKKRIESIKERTIFLLDCIPDISVYNGIPFVNNMSVLPKGPQIK